MRDRIAERFDVKGFPRAIIQQKGMPLLDLDFAGNATGMSAQLLLLLLILQTRLVGSQTVQAEARESFDGISI